MNKFDEYKADPVLMVQELFDVEPDEWQKDALYEFAGSEHDRISMQACAGPGKSAVLSWMAINFLLCYNQPGYHPKGACVSMTHTNLMDNLWSEIYHWLNKNEFLKQNFKWTKDKTMAADHSETWFISARSFQKTSNRDELGKTLSGLHAKYVLFLLDEAGSIPPEVGKTAEQALSNCEFGKVVLAGNPTSQDGYLYKASKDPAFYKIQITGDPEDPKRSPRISMDWAKSMIGKYGRSDPWVKSMILGQFPDQAITSLLSDVDIDKAEARRPRPSDFMYAPKVLGVDAARFGDDSCVIYPRQGCMSFKYKGDLRNYNGPQLGDAVINSMIKWKCSDNKPVEVINIDGTGGYGASCFDFLQSKGISGLNEINFSAKATGASGSTSTGVHKFMNKRAQMYWRLREWVLNKGALVPCKNLREELTNMQYSFVGDKIKIEAKDILKQRIGRSPDASDALALSFAYPDDLKGVDEELRDMLYGSSEVEKSKYDPLKWIKSKARRA